MAMTRSIFRKVPYQEDHAWMIEGHPEEIHLELESFSSGFFAHGHDQHVIKGRFDDDNKPVAVLCWIDDDRRVSGKVHKVFELQSLLRESKKIAW